MMVSAVAGADDLARSTFHEIINVAVRQCHTITSYGAVAWEQLAGDCT